MGTVYLAIDSQLKRTVALKVLHKDRAENETLVRRFESEATASAQLKHENIVTVYDAGRIDGHLYIALEFVDGTDIHELVAKRGPLPLKRSVNFVRQIAHALDHLHTTGLRAPRYQAVEHSGDQESQAKLTDMGLARAVDESLESNITREGTTVGTVDYMAPEQARDSQSADIRSDIYALGCTWYQMLTGEPPFPTGSVTNKLYAHISKPRPDPRALNRSVPEEVVAILHKMMARKADDRYQTPVELLEDLANLGSANKRIEELLGGDDEYQEESASPIYDTPTPLPARQVPGRSAPPTRRGESETASETPPRPDRRLPARRDHLSSDDDESPSGSQAPQTVPPLTPGPQRMPARQGRSTSDSTPISSRSTARSVPDPARDVTPRPGARARHADMGDDQPAVRERNPRRADDSPASQSSPASRRLPARRPLTINEEPLRSDSEAGGTTIDWKPLATKAAVLAGGLLLLALASGGECLGEGQAARAATATRSPLRLARRRPSFPRKPKRNSMRRRSPRLSRTRRTRRP